MHALFRDVGWALGAVKEEKFSLTALQVCVGGGNSGQVALCAGRRLLRLW